MPVRDEPFGWSPAMARIVPADVASVRPVPERRDVLHQPIDVAAFDRAGVMAVLGIHTVEASAARVVLQVPVSDHVHQPYGVLHGGVSALLAETAASYGGALAAPPGHRVLGVELNASHLRAMREGVLTATATPARVGRSLQVWDIDLTDDAGRRICRARCTLAVSRPKEHEDR